MRPFCDTSLYQRNSEDHLEAAGRQEDGIACLLLVEGRMNRLQQTPYEWFCAFLVEYKL
jgi:hypothetical protein